VNNGGPAFPRPFSGNNTHQPAQVGMTLRDYFAAAALTGFIANQQAAAAVVKAASSAHGANRVFSETAYDLADAMLAEREKKGAS
jgi:hypothetical protein